MFRLIAILLFLSAPVLAQSTAEQTVPGTLSVINGQVKWAPYSSTNQLPIAVYDSGNHSGYCYTSNGSGSPATFQSCGGGGGTPGGTTGQIQYNNSDAFGGFTASGDCTITPSTGAIVCTATNGVPFGSLATLNAAPAGTLTGTTLASNVVNSSLTGAAGGSFGTAAYVNTGTSGATLPFLNGLNTWSNTQTFVNPIIESADGAASTSAATLSGTPFSGTTTNSTPLLYLNNSSISPTTWNSAGTYYGINMASGFSGNAMEIHGNGGGAVYRITGLGAVANALSTQSGSFSASLAPTASTSSISSSAAILTGGSGTTNFPHFFIQPSGATAATTWSTAGTGFGMNMTSGFSGNFLDFRVNGGSSVFAVDSSGTVKAGIWNGTSIANANLANSATTVNGQTCTLGSTCTVTAAATTINGLLANGAGIGLSGSGTSGSPYSISLANPSATTIGGVESIAAVAHNFLTSISTSGVPAQAQPAFADISGQATNAQLATQTANTVLGALTATTPSGLSLPSCSTSASALNYTSGTGFSCNTSVAANTATTATNIAGGLANGIPYQTGAATTTFLAQGTGILQEAGGAPSWSTALANGTTATTQASSDNSTKVATTAYVTTGVQNALNGLDWKQAVGYATTANVIGVNVSGVFTYTSTGVDTIDGHTLALNDQLLFKNQTTGADNGVWVVTTAGTIGIAGVLTRRSDYNTSTDIQVGDTFYVANGTTNGNTSWVQTDVVNTINSDPLAFNQVSGPGTYAAGIGLTLTGNSFSVNASQTQITALGTIVTGIWNGTAIANANLANSSMTLAGHSVSLGGTQAFACGDLSNGATGCSTATGTSGATISLNNGNNVYSGNVLFTGAVPTLANGDASVAASATLGGIYTGQGSVNDITLQNKSGTSICVTATGATTFNCTGLQVGGVSVLTGNQSITLSGDTTGSGTTAITTTLAAVNTNIGSFGSSTAIPNFTVNGKGLITAAGTSVVIAPAGTLSGTTLNSAVVTSSLTSTGALTPGGDLTMSAHNIITDTTTGTKIGTGSTQKLGFFGVTPVAQQTGNVATALTNLGLVTSPTITATTNANLTGDVTSVGNATTLATVNSNVGSFTNASVTVNGKGLITAVSNGVATSSTAPTIQNFTSSTGTYTTPAGVRWIRVRMIGGGGGGGGGGNGGAAGGTGGATTFGTTLLVANGGASTGSNQGGSTGGTASLGSGPIGIALQGGSGGAGGKGASTVNGAPGGTGCSSPFGGSGGGAGGDNAGAVNSPSSAAIANTGSGGGGGSATSANPFIGSGGACGGYIDAIISAPSATYSYAVGAAGSTGTAGTNGTVGGLGGSGLITVEEHYNY